MMCKYPPVPHCHHLSPPSSTLPTLYTATARTNTVPAFRRPFLFRSILQYIIVFLRLFLQPRFVIHIHGHIIIIIWSKPALLGSGLGCGEGNTACFLFRWLNGAGSRTLTLVAMAVGERKGRLGSWICVAMLPMGEQHCHHRPVPEVDARASGQVNRW
ncbi:hypothetical protein BT67DRAFT_184283 [Trichocladium antarcticum]|uniref:Uncharacterized protein n=1 Tax=Trichocladium antarcticum TaxID=1450529 RepID=A0AAN6UPH9_9PEZI|nr:hypothetical protein BT67DRAFT_184283 [Trichocladium antarcticum]